jgi:hypothetical protein
MTTPRFPPDPMPPLIPTALRPIVQGSARRHFLRLLVTLAAALPPRLLFAAPADKTVQRISLSALATYLDTLIPADSTPSASQLGTDQAIVALARRREHLARLVGLGCGWLDQQAVERGAVDFAALPQAEREAVVALAENAPARSMPRAFFAFTHRQAFTHYYAQPASWRGLGFEGPPQPVGFPDFAQPPKAIR